MTEKTLKQSIQKRACKRLRNGLRTDLIIKIFLSIFSIFERLFPKKRDIQEHYSRAWPTVRYPNTTSLNIVIHSFLKGPAFHKSPHIN